jgi:hypothetical protein
LPEDWRSRFPEDATAPAVGNLKGHGWLFFFRTPRLVRQTAREHIHDAVFTRMRFLRRYRPKAEVSGEGRGSHLRPERPAP